MPAVVRRRSLGNLTALILGIPLGLAVVSLATETSLLPEEMRRYVEHPVEQAEIVLFCCGAMVLISKLLGWLRERATLRQQLIPAWNGQAAPVADAATLSDQLAQQAGVHGTWLGRRLHAGLDFVRGRGSANELDDHLRTLSDNDANELDGSYAMLRFVTWAIPILGFLGTVVGITAAVAGVTPETLEQSLSEVTGGLATAFDTTALALCLTMVLMFGNSIVERLENGLLQSVDAHVEGQLAHRFQRSGPDASPVVEALRTNTQSLVTLTEQLVERQVALWSKSFEKAERHWSDAGQRHTVSMQQALEAALDAALERHARHLRQAEDQFAARTEALVAGLSATVELFSRQTEALEQLQGQEAQLVRLQETLHDNLSALAGAGAFEQAVQSLTAAIHLLTTRVSATSHRSAAA
jgi:biopolymer transport protein ExbB/TolQ